MPKKKASSDGTNKLKIRGDKELAENITEISENHVKQHQAENPIKTNIRLKQFPWTEKQKEFFKIALHPSTNIVIVKGPAGTSKTLLATYCALQLLNMKVINSIMYYRESITNILGNKIT